MAADAHAQPGSRPADPMHASLAGLLESLRDDETFAKIANGEAEPASDDIDALQEQGEQM